MEIPQAAIDYLEHHYCVVHDWVIHNDAHVRQLQKADPDGYFLPIQISFEDFLSMYDQAKRQITPFDSHEFYPNEEAD